RPGTPAIDSRCYFNGQIKFSPGLTTTPTPQTLTISNSLVGTNDACVLAPGEPAGAMLGRLYSPSLSCLPDGRVVSNSPAKGKAVITWPDSSTSSVRLHWFATTKAAQTLVFSGKVTAGTYVGDKAAGHARFLGTPGGGSCSSGGTWKKISFYAYADGQQQRLLTFSHT
ncbi:MAG TPA: hypothetical protein VIK61_02575, partial [Acidimicrobiia bacterium]